MKASAKQAHLMKEQFKAHHEEHMNKSKWEKDSYPNYKIKVEPPKFVEFGRTFAIPAVMLTDDNTVRMTYDMALSDFFKSKAESFPTWTGLPEIKIAPSTDPLRRDVQIAWYAQVPREHVISQDEKLEDDLWNS